jgi:hypothetical protein
MTRSRLYVLSLLSLFALTPAALLSQEATVSGRVTSEDGNPLSNVSVFITDLGVGSFTRDDGAYSFTIPGARVTNQTITLSARRVGFRAKSIRMQLHSGAITQDFVLSPNPLMLGEVVVTGAGTATTVERLGNVRNVVSTDLIAKSNETNVVQSLAGKAPNVQVSQASGDPGANSRISIRGLRTLNGNTEPLFIVDGIPVSNYTFSTTNFKSD